MKTVSGHGTSRSADGLLPTIYPIRKQSVYDICCVQNTVVFETARIMPRDIATEAAASGSHCSLSKKRTSRKDSKEGWSTLWQEPRHSAETKQNAHHMWSFIREVSGTNTSRGVSVQDTRHCCIVSMAPSLINEGTFQFTAGYFLGFSAVTVFGIASMRLS